MTPLDPEGAQRLYAIAKLLLFEDHPEKTAEVLLRHVLEATGADRGFIVVREEEGFVQKFDVRFGREQVSQDARRFSRNLVRQAIETGQILDSSQVLQDPRFSGAESALLLQRVAALAAPLRSGGEVYGVVYLQTSAQGFEEPTKRLLTEFTEIAGQSLRKALERERLERRARSLERDLFAGNRFPGIVTRHPKMIELLENVTQVADSEATVLVLGETGTGKELIAQALHANSPRKDKPFVTLHCTALPGSILESELFGHVRGAFTGADRNRAGRIAAANGGTLFLDEIGEIPRKLQAKLLRFLQFGEIQRLGSDTAEKLDTRVIAATHRDLPAMVRAKRFRQDLYFRLNVVPLRIPPLRQRKSDLPLLLDHFLRQSWRRPETPPSWTLQAEQALNAYDYPGNVRELEHLVQRACLLAKGPTLDLVLLPEELGGGAASGPAQRDLSKEGLRTSRETAVTAVERSFLTALMERHAGNVSKAARESGLNRTHLQRMLAEHRLIKRAAAEDE